VASRKPSCTANKTSARSRAWLDGQQVLLVIQTQRFLGYCVLKQNCIALREKLELLLEFRIKYNKQQLAL
jgi:hypothetical protein